MHRYTVSQFFPQFALLICFLFAPFASAAPDPKQAVQAATDQLLAKLVEVQPIYATDPEKFFKEVDDSLEPFIDFEGFAKGVMAKYYRRASNEQQQRFIKVFRTSLVETYAKALVGFNNQKVVVLDPETKPDRPDRATISLEVYAEDGTIYQVDYSLALMNDQWLLRNIVINGINIGLQFRSQFAAFMSKYNNNIDEVITNWAVDG